MYLWPADCDRPQIRIEHAPYSTRILVYKPRDPKRFSGVVVMENFNNSTRIDISKVGWTICHEELAANGDAQVDECLKALVEDRWLILRGADQISRQAHTFHWKK